MLKLQDIVKERFDGIAIELNPNKKISFSNLKVCFYRLIEIYFIYIGYFADLIQMRINYNNQDLIFINSKTPYRTNVNNIDIEKRLFLINSGDLSKAYENWLEVRNKNILVILMLINALNNRDNYDETKTSIIIQCIEGYFRANHKTELERFNDTVKKSIADVLKESLNNSKEIILLCEKEKLEIKDIESNLNESICRINKKSLKELIYLAINYKPDTKKIFAYEEDNGLLDDFIEKTKNHRNFLAHLYPSKNHFTGKENILAQEKLILLLRLIILNDIELEVEESSLNHCITKINEYYN